MGRRVWRNAAGLGLAVAVSGASFGVLAVASGISVVMTCALSLAVFAGGSQFAALGVATGGGSAAAAIGAGLLLNGRFVPFGLAVAPLLRGPLASRALAAHLLVDETAAMALAAPDLVAGRRTYWITGATLYGAWNLATLGGALAGSAIPDPGALGLDAAFPAGFLALLAPLLRDARSRAAAVGGGLVVLVLTPVAPPGVAILASAVGALAGLAVRAPTSGPARTDAEVPAP